MPAQPFHETGSTVSSAAPRSDGDWEAALRDWPQASFFHHSTWSRLLEQTYGFTPSNFLAREGGRVRGMLPMMEVRSAITGNRGISLPFTDEVEPLCDSGATFAHLFQSAVETGVARNWKYLEFRGCSRFLEAKKPSLSFYGHRLNLSADISALFHGFDASTRRAIRKAESGGLTVEFTHSLESVREFYALLGRTRQRHGLPPQPFSFFKNLRREVLVKGHGWLVLAKSGSVPIAGAVFLHQGAAAIYKYGASHESYQHLRANNLVMWTAIQRYASDGCHSLDFGRTSLRNDGLRRFKLGWGSTETQIDYFKYDFRTRDFTFSHDESTGWHNRFFNILPRSVAQLIGTLVYKHIA